MPFIYSIKNKSLGLSVAGLVMDIIFMHKKKSVVSMEKAEGEGDCKGEREELSL